MTNELVSKYVGKRCIVSTGTFGATEDGEILSVSENWLELKTKKTNLLINIDFITSIREVVAKN